MAKVRGQTCRPEHRISPLEQGIFLPFDGLDPYKLGDATRTYVRLSCNVPVLWINLERRWDLHLATIEPSLQMWDQHRTWKLRMWGCRRRPGMMKVPRIPCRHPGLKNEQGCVLEVLTTQVATNYYVGRQEYLGSRHVTKRQLQPIGGYVLWCVCIWYSRCL